MSRDQFIWLGFAVGLIVYVFGPVVWARVKAWWAPEPLADYRLPYRDDDR